jgi:hypothetical protein
VTAAALKLGGRYGNIGVEIVDAQTGVPVALVNRWQEQRRAWLSQHGRHDEDPLERARREREVESLDETLPDAINVAMMLAAAPTLYATLVLALDAMCSVPQADWCSDPLHREMREALKQATDIEAAYAAAYAA